MSTKILQNETIKDFYRKQDIIPPNELGHFNISTIEDLDNCFMEPIPYIRRNYYKVSLLKGKYKVHYADKTYTIQKQALVFSNPSIPYNWIPLEGKHSGAYCLFTPEFFHQFGTLDDYAVFQANGNHILELEEEQFLKVENCFKKMEETFSSNYAHKFDQLRNLIFEIVHLGTKLAPQTNNYKSNGESSKRITRAFLELLEHQFPIEAMDQQLTLSSPSDFANKLSLHVNYLNRILKKTMGSSTSQLIHDRIVREAKILLKHSSATISEIAYLLGFKEVTHFSNFFKKSEGIAPSDFRKV
ncbi:helix-turn-helix domain-containing protein [Zunongwangia sp. HGR-M22]|uniref:helix-turn-helix domain-containing protein n=1 Tax=Zunongwangia sp. HGR-M22 TaxID=3015168 RepID=UPI0022DDDF58|nr:helix-turn-helix domain-containing protein [Zunongwangia sp. HGR-M22]WBL24317.1 helix-turn-helix domain-containing protein [Zunongwangia sp. HGR-M22]